MVYRSCCGDDRHEPIVIAEMTLESAMSRRASALPRERGSRRDRPTRVGGVAGVVLEVSANEWSSPMRGKSVVVGALQVLLVNGRRGVRKDNNVSVGTPP